MGYTHTYTYIGHVTKVIYVVDSFVCSFVCQIFPSLKSYKVIPNYLKQQENELKMFFNFLTLPHPPKNVDQTIQTCSKENWLKETVGFWSKMKKSKLFQIA